MLIKDFKNELFFATRRTELRFQRRVGRRRRARARDAAGGVAENLDRVEPLPAVWVAGAPLPACPEALAAGNPPRRRLHQPRHGALLRCQLRCELPREQSVLGRQGPKKPGTLRWRSNDSRICRARRLIKVNDFDLGKSLCGVPYLRQGVPSKAPPTPPPARSCLHSLK